MSGKILKKLWAVAKNCGAFTFSFWILETLFFLVTDGWHWKACNVYEERCDTIVVTFGFITFLITLFVITEITSLILDEIDE